MSISPQKKSLGVTDCKRNFVSCPSYQSSCARFQNIGPNRFCRELETGTSPLQKICHSDGAKTLVPLDSVPRSSSILKRLKKKICQLDGAMTFGRTF